LIKLVGPAEGLSLAFNALGESLRIVLDPTMKDR
jgi:hypothetical protein